MILKIRASAATWGVCLTLWLALWHWWMYRQVWANPSLFVQGPMGDNIVMIWNLGWIWHAFDAGHLGFWFDNAYYPSDFFFLYGTHTWLDAALGYPFRHLLGEMPFRAVLWANLMQLFATVATGWGASFALRQWGVTNRWVRLLGASMVTFCWFRSFAASGHYHFYGTQWMVLSLALFSAARRCFVGGFWAAGYRRALAGGLVLGITFLNDQTHTIFASVLGGLMIGSLFSRANWKRVMLIGSIFYGASLVFASIHLIPIIDAIMSGRFSYKVNDLHLPRLMDASSLLLPNDWHLWAGRIVRQIRGENAFTISEGSFFGTMQWLSLAVVGCWLARGVKRFRVTAHRRRTILWVWLACCTFVMFAAGERLKIGDVLHNYLPGRALREIPVINNIRLLQRWIWPAQLCIALCACLWLQRILVGRDRWLSRALLLSLAAYAAAEGKFYPPPNPVSILDPVLNPPGLIDGIRRHYKQGGIYPMPVQAAYGHNNYMQLRVGYEYPLTVSYTARAPFNITHTPWGWSEWKPEGGPFLVDKKVGMVIFPFHPGDCGEFNPWIKAARSAVPGLVVLNMNGEEVF